MKTLVLRIEYDGTNYSGWQRQKNAVSVQQRLEESLARFIDTEPSVVAGGRTDTGVHARGQVAHVKLGSELKIPAGKLTKVINAGLPRDIMVSGASIIEGPFHARFDAVAREYSYTVCFEDSVFNRLYSYFPGYPIDRELLVQSAEAFRGRHDFTTFSKFNPETKHYFCNVKKCEWKKAGRGKMVLRILSDRFVYGMVRALTGAMLDVARGKRTIDGVSSALEQADRSLISPMAPPNGLVLEKIYYPKSIKLFS